MSFTKIIFLALTLMASVGCTKPSATDWGSFSPDLKNSKETTRVFGSGKAAPVARALAQIIPDPSICKIVAERRIPVYVSETFYVRQDKRRTVEHGGRRSRFRKKETNNDRFSMRKKIKCEFD